MNCWARVTRSRVTNCSGDIPMACLNTRIHDLDQHVVVTDRAARELVWLEFTLRLENREALGGDALRWLRCLGRREAHQGGQY